MKKIYMYVVDTMADWEHGYLLQALTLQAMLPEQKVAFQTVGKTKKTIKTSAGMTITPDISLDEMDLDCTSALILVGGDTWLCPEQKSILDIASQLLKKNTTVAAICGATLGLAAQGE